MKTKVSATRGKSSRAAKLQPAKVVETVQTSATVQTAPPKKVSYLSEGVTGKQLVSAKITANRANRDELHSMSFCIKQFIKHGTDVLKGLRGADVASITPANLIKHMTERERAKFEQSGRVSFWLVETLVVRMYKAGK